MCSNSQEIHGEAGTEINPGNPGKAGIAGTPISPGNSWKSRENLGNEQIPGKAGIRIGVNSLNLDNQHQTSTLLIFAYPTALSIATSYAHIPVNLLFKKSNLWGFWGKKYENWAIFLMFALLPLEN